MQPVSISTTVCSTVQFICTARGFQLIHVVWKKDGSSKLPRTAVITPSSSLDMNDITTTLQINETIGYYSGWYTCVARNSAGIVSSYNAILHVKGNMF